jgi:chromosomal replication initiation ATPase DnaA
MAEPRVRRRVSKKTGVASDCDVDTPSARLARLKAQQQQQQQGAAAAAAPSPGAPPPISRTRVQVCVRARPPIASMDGSPGANPSMLIDEDQRALQLPSLQGRSAKTYQLDAVFGPERTNDEVYEHAFAPSVAQMLEGFNVTIFAYGQTGSGKTHTMTGVYYSEAMLASKYGALAPSCHR